MITVAGFGRAAAIAVLLSGACLGFSARAQEISADHLAAGRDAIGAIGVTERFDIVLPRLAEQLKGQLIQASPNVQDAITKVVDEQALALAPRRADLEKEAATIYAKTFSLQELKAIAAFYNSEAGKKLLKDGPIASRELLKAADIWAAGINRDLNAQSMSSLQKVAGDKLQPLPEAALPGMATPSAAAAPAPAAKAPAAPAAKP